MGSAAELHPVGRHHHSSAPFHLLLDRLEHVTKYGTGWRAKCPAHDGKSTSSLSIAAADDGRILIHCFGGCEPLAIVHAVGLELSDLFEKRITADMTPKERRKLRQAAKQAQWEAARSMLHHEAQVAWVAGKQIRAGEPLNDDDDARLDLALDRITEAGRVLNGR